MVNSLIVTVLAVNYLVSISGNVFTFGLWFSWEGWYPVGQHGGAGGVLITMDAIMSNIAEFSSFHPHGHKLNFTYVDTKCDRSIGLPFIPEMVFGKFGFPKVDAFIGPGCSIICEPGGHLVKEWNIPMVSFICTSPNSVG